MNYVLLSEICTLLNFIYLSNERVFFLIFVFCGTAHYTQGLILFIHHLNHVPSSIIILVVFQVRSCMFALN
jgi:hypothetical protein